jgi:hypothetical protein
MKEIISEGETRRASRELSILPCRKAEEIREMHEKQRTPGYAATTPKWEKPQPDFLKINVDRGFDPTTKKGSWGYILFGMRMGTLSELELGVLTALLMLFIQN